MPCSCSSRLPSAKSPIVPAKSNRGFSNATVTATRSCRSHEPSSGQNSRTPNQQLFHDLQTTVPFRPVRFS